MADVLAVVKLREDEVAVAISGSGDVGHCFCRSRETPAIALETAPRGS